MKSLEQVEISEKLLYIYKITIWRDAWERSYKGTVRFEGNVSLPINYKSIIRTNKRPYAKFYVWGQILFLMNE
jgi:hypothetical protein